MATGGLRHAMPGRPISMRLRIISTVWLAGASTLLAGLAAELWLRMERADAVRAAQRYCDANVFHTNAMTGGAGNGVGTLWARRWVKYRPNARVDLVIGAERFVITTNSRGFRTHEFDVPKPQGMLRVVCIGGSTTVAGRTNDETYPARLEAGLRSRHPGVPLEVLNFGTSGVTSEHWRSRFDRVLAAEPDIVVHYEAVNDIAWLQLPRYAPRHPLRAWLYGSLLLERVLPFPVREFEPFLWDTLQTRQDIARTCREHGIDYLGATFAAPDIRRATPEFRDHLDVATEYWTRHFRMRRYATYAAILARHNELFLEFAERGHIAHVRVHEQIDDPALFSDLCHFTPAGIERLADVFLPEVDALLQGRPAYKGHTGDALRVVARAAPR